MKNKKRYLAIALVVALIAIISVGTLAWFTDSDEVTNVFTFGEVSITLHDENEDGKPFNGEDGSTQQPLLPGVPVVKTVYAENTASSALSGNDAYVRTFIGVPEKLDSVLEKTWDTTGDWTLDNADYIAEIDGVRYKVYQFTYTGAVDGKLAAGDKTAPVLSKIELKKEVDCKGGKLCLPNEDGSYTIFDFDINELRELKVPVAMQAIQTGGFENADQAFEAGFNGCPWDQAAPEQNQDENPADINVIIKGADLNKDSEFTWNAPAESGFEKVEISIPAGTFDVPVKANFKTAMNGNCNELSLSFYELDENGNVKEDEDGDPICVTPDTDKLSVTVYSPYPEVGDSTNATCYVEIVLGDDADWGDYIAIKNCIHYVQTGA